jgi:tetratricopeptide (TPR) repeat protein
MISRASRKRGILALLAAAAALFTLGCTNFSLVNLDLPFSGKRASPVAGIVDAPDEPHYYFFLGKDALDHGAPETALEHFRRAVKMKPDFYEAWIGGGHAQMALGAYRRAEAAFKRARKLRDTPDARLHLARARLFRGDLDEAEELALSVREGDNPQLALVEQTLGAIAYQRGDLEAALEHWNASLELDSSNGALLDLRNNLRAYLNAYPSEKE